MPSQHSMISVLERRPDGHRVIVDHERLDRTGLPFATFHEAWNRLPSELLVAGRPLRQTIDLGRTTGLAAIVKAPVIRPDEKTSFARRRNTLHMRPSRVIKLKGPMPRSHYVTIVGDWKPDHEQWLLRTAYAGQYVYPQPWDFSAIVKNGWSLKNVLDWWCKAAFLWRARDFESRLHEDTWAGLIDNAARVQRADIVERVGYEQVRQAWATEIASNSANRSP